MLDLPPPAVVATVSTLDISHITVVEVAASWYGVLVCGMSPPPSGNLTNH